MSGPRGEGGGYEWSQGGGGALVSGPGGGGLAQRRRRLASLPSPTPAGTTSSPLKHGLSTEHFSVSAYVGSFKKVKDLKADGQSGEGISPPRGPH